MEDNYRVMIDTLFDEYRDVEGNPDSSIYSIMMFAISIFAISFVYLHIM
jgi:hypothetical protein